MVSAPSTPTFRKDWLVFLVCYDRSTFPSRWEPTARNALSTLSTRFRSTRRARTPSSDREREDMMLSSQASVARPSPSSERSPRPPRRSLSSLNAQFARPVDLIPSSVASHSFSERRISLRVVPSSEHHWVIDLAANGLRVFARKALSLTFCQSLQKIIFIYILRWLLTITNHISIIIHYWISWPI